MTKYLLASVYEALARWQREGRCDESLLIDCAVEAWLVEGE
jgi:hypothetical protein